ncbi:MAG: S9 family peptidase [bacterium]|nr:S9 family peptidase [bacterium]
MLCVIVGFAFGASSEDLFSVQQILSSAYPTNLVAAPHGDAVAWVRNDEGKRNIWVAAPPKYEGRKITDYAEDDGQVVNSLRFTPDGKTIVYVRGGAPNRSGEIPNPESRSVAIERALWAINIEDGPSRKLAQGSSPAIAPSGEAVAFLNKDQVWMVSLEDGAEPEQLFQIRGKARSSMWSPDGNNLAFESDRGDHGYIGVYNLELKTLRYLDPSVDRDADPTWSPDSTRVAFIRIVPPSDYLPFMPLREGEPWSIRVADISTGKGSEVWRAEEGRGSVFRGIDSQHQLFWGADDRLVFPWERTGWTLLYSTAIGSAEATVLTPGSFEVEHATISPDRRQMVFSSNQNDVDRRHLWRVTVSGGTPTSITQGDGIEWSPVVTSPGGAVAYLASDAQTPAHARIQAGNGESSALVADALPSKFPLTDLVEPKQVIFPGADGILVHGQLFLPKTDKPDKRHPGVLFFHGGSRRQMFLGWHNRGYYHQAYGFNQYLASRGFVVLSVNYRSGIGYGMEFREALNYGARGASEFNDVLGAGLYLASRSDVDAKRIGLWGGSYGGYLTALGLARASDLFAAGVDLHGVHDWNIVIRNFAPGYDPAEHAEVARLAFDSSPMASVKDWRSPVLLIHADDDRNVPFSETVDLVEALRKYEVEFEQLIFPDDVHSFLLHRNWIEAYKATADFFERKLNASIDLQSTAN